MADEFQHSTPGSSLTQAEFEAQTGAGAHVVNNQARGDMIISNTAATGLIRLAKGATGTFLVMNANDPAWVAVTRGEILIRDATTIVGLTIGSANAVLLSDGTDPTWSSAVPRATLLQEDLALYDIPLAGLRQADQAVMGITGTSGDHFYDISGNAPVLLGNTPSSSTVTDISTFDFALPAEYVDGETITLRINAKVDATADTNSLDLEAYLVNKLAGTVGSDIQSTTIKSTTASAVAYDFTITPTSLVAGDMLHFLMTTVNADGDGSDGIVSIFSIQAMIDIKG